MKFTQHTVIHAPIEEVDLEDWLFTLSDSDYQGAAKAHRAAGTFTSDGVRGMVNVESMGGTLIIQHYKAIHAEPTRVEMVSERSRAYIFHLFPTPVRVRWTMTAAARTADTTTFTCIVEADMPPALRLPSKLTGLEYFVRKHVDEETLGFAADITRKLRAHV
ncbi:MAG: hypothetical protein QOE41_4587 [Mycobacterium sp.]|jgi:hypothetical protein|nr:hypothetical protein [Mycobacterium sp.]MDT5135276.1 hypothetical protein [Mycobacterium sp.]